MASITGNGSKGHHKFILTVTETATSTANNTSTVSYKFQIAPIQTSWNWSQWGAYIKYSFKVNGVEYTGSIDAYDGYSTVTLKSGTQTVTHNADGSKSISYSFSVTDTSGVTYTSGNASASGTLALTKIPRYATVNQSLKSKTETAITMNWSADATCDYVWYSLDLGKTWKAVGSVNAKSGSYTISSLSANTSYNIITRCRRKDSQLASNSAGVIIATYNYPYCTKAPDFTIGNAVKIEFYNPLSRNITWQIDGADGSLIARNTTTGTSYTGISGDGSVANLYASIPNAKSGTYTVKVTYGSVVNTKTGGKYSIKGTEIPTINSFTYIDNNSTTVALTGNNQHIVQNYSSLVARVGSATANKGAGGIAKYVVECNGKTVQNTSSGNFTVGAVNSNRNVDVKLTVTDTRGLSASKTITVTMLAHSTPTANVTLERLNNYEDETYLTVDGSVSSVNSKNTMAIKYRYKQSGGSYGSYVNINDRQKYTLSLDKNKAFIFNIVVTDALGSTFNKEFVLEKGVFPLFIDTVLNSVGVNGFPTSELNLFVNGSIVAESGNGWVRYYDGTQICYGQQTIQPNYKEWGALYSLDDATVRNFPKPFKESPRLLLTNNGSVACIIIRGLASATAITTISVARANIVEQAVTIDYLAIGKWK